MRYRIAAAIVGMILVLTACNPIPSWVRSVINAVVYTGPSSGPIGLGTKPATLSCAISVARSNNARIGDYALRDYAWAPILRKDPTAFARFCAVPALNQTKSLPVFKYEYGAPAVNDNRSQAMVVLLIDKNPDPDTLLGSGWWTYPMDVNRFKTAYVQAWAQHPNLVLGDLG